MLTYFDCHFASFILRCLFLSMFSITLSYFFIIFLSFLLQCVVTWGQLRVIYTKIDYHNISSPFFIGLYCGHCNFLCTSLVFPAESRKNDDFWLCCICCLKYLLFCSWFWAKMFLLQLHPLVNNNFILKRLDHHYFLWVDLL